jgi:hypothetical protein
MMFLNDSSGAHGTYDRGALDLHTPETNRHPVAFTGLFGAAKRLDTIRCHVGKEEMKSLQMKGAEQDLQFLGSFPATSDEENFRK